MPKNGLLRTAGRPQLNRMRDIENELEIEKQGKNFVNFAVLKIKFFPLIPIVFSFLENTSTNTHKISTQLVN